MLEGATYGGDVMIIQLAASRRLAATCGLLILLSLCAACTTVSRPATGYSSLGEEIARGGAPQGAAPRGGLAGHGAEGGVVAPAPGLRPNVDVVRYIGTDRSKWLSTRAPQNLADLYTRLEVETTETGAGTASDGVSRSYRLERRGWLARLFVDRTINITTLAKAEGRDPDLMTSLPLFTVSHES